MRTKAFFLLLAASALACSGALAQERASQATNFELGVDAQDASTAGSTSTGALGLRALATIPLGRYLGAALGGGYAETTVRARDALRRANNVSPGLRSNCEFDSTDTELTLFARRPTLGKIAVSYGAGRLSADCGEGLSFIWSGEDTQETDHYRIDVEYYFGDFTVAASQISTDLDGGPKIESTEVRASWYPLHNVRLSLSGADLYEQNTYGLLIENQPEFLGDALGVYLGYAHTDDTPHTRTVQFGLRYYFGTRVDLKTRDRHYR